MSLQTARKTATASLAIPAILPAVETKSRSPMSLLNRIPRSEWKTIPLRGVLSTLHFVLLRKRHGEPDVVGECLTGRRDGRGDLHGHKHRSTRIDVSAGGHRGLPTTTLHDVFERPSAQLH